MSKENVEAVRKVFEGFEAGKGKLRRGREARRNDLDAPRRPNDQARLLQRRGRATPLRVEFEVKAHRAREAWRVVLVHERRVEWRGTVRTHGSSNSFRIRRTVDDLDGPDQARIRATGPRGITCEASATLRA